MGKKVIVCAHRGASHDFPENTIPAFITFRSRLK